MTSWTSLLRPLRRHPQRPLSRTRRGLSLESLESRLAPAVTADVVGTQLLITGDAGTNTAVVSRVSGGIRVFAADGITSATGNPAGAGAFTFPQTTVTDVSVLLLAGNDSLTVDNSAAVIGVPVAYDGGGISDALTFLGTDTADTISLAFTASDTATITLTSGFGTQSVNTLNTSNYSVETLGGSDVVSLTGNAQASGSLALVGGDSDGDVLRLISAAGTANAVTIAANSTVDPTQTVSGLGTTFSSAGFEEIDAQGQAADNDTLTLFLGSIDNTAFVGRGTGFNGLEADLVTSNSLPDVQFTGQNAFTLNLDLGTDVATFAPFFLVGATPANYMVGGAGRDSVIIQGTALGDNYTVSPATSVNGGFRVTETTGGSSGVTISDSGEVSPLGLLQFNTLAGGDTITIQGTKGTTPTNNTRIVVNGGAPFGPSDTVLLQGVNGASDSF